MGTDALQAKWKGQKVYVFPPFCLIGHFLKESSQRGCGNDVDYSGLPIATMVPKTVGNPILLPPYDGLTGPQRYSHLLVETGSLTIAAWKVCGNERKCQVFHKKLAPFLPIDGEMVRKPLANTPGVREIVRLVKSKYIHFLPLW